MRNDKSSVCSLTETISDAPPLSFGHFTPPAGKLHSSPPSRVSCYVASADAVEPVSESVGLGIIWGAPPASPKSWATGSRAFRWSWVVVMVRVARGFPSPMLASCSAFGTAAMARQARSDAANGFHPRSGRRQLLGMLNVAVLATWRSPTQGPSFRFFRRVHRSP